MATWPVTLSDAKAELNIPSTDTSNDTELQGFIDAVTEVVENITGPINSTGYTETYPGYAPTIVLNRYPVVSVTSVTEYDAYGTGTLLNNEPLGTATYTDLGYQSDLTVGSLTRTDGGMQSRFDAQVVVSYNAGRATVPASVRLAALELIRMHWVSSQRGFTGTFGQPGEEFAGTTILGFFVPNKVLDLLAAYRKAPHV